MTRIIGFDFQLLIQMAFQLVAVFIAIYVVIKLITLLLLLIEVSKKKSRLLDIQIAKAEDIVNVNKPEE